jgi:hypothetical protein
LAGDRFVGAPATNRIEEGASGAGSPHALPEKDLVKTATRLLLWSLAALGPASLGSCGGDDASTVSAGGSSGSAGQGEVGGSSASGGGGRDGGSTTIDGGGCPGSTPNDGEHCGQRDAKCYYDDAICSCRGTAPSWRCVYVATDAEVPHYDAGLPYLDAGLAFDAGGCPSGQPASGSSCTVTGASIYVCDYGGTTCVCFKRNQSAWACY